MGHISLTITFQIVVGPIGLLYFKDSRLSLEQEALCGASKLQVVCVEGTF